MPQKYNESPIQKASLKQNPYTKPNPYKLKVQFHTSQTKQARQRYLSTGSTDSPYNPEYFVYKRNYKQTPPTRQDNYVSLLHQSRSIVGQNHGFGAPQIDYRVKLNNYLAEKFCPTDGYLEAVKDKFILFATDKDSHFQNLMRTSHVKGHNRQDQNLVYSNFPKENPFNRKNLISASSEKSNADSLYNSIVYTASNYISSSQVNHVLNTIDDSYATPRQYYNTPDEKVPPPKLQSKDINIQRNSTGRHQSKVCDGVPKGENNSQKSIKSFGPQKWLQKKKKVHSFVDAVIEKSLNRNQLEEKAPKQISINGKKFFLQKVKRTKT